MKTPASFTTSGSGTEKQFTNVAEAFTRTAEKYESYTRDHPNLARMRAKVYDNLFRNLEPGARILELNGGSGIDAVFLAQQGFSVHNTDISPGMLSLLQQKVDRLGLGDQISLQECSFTDLGQIQDGPYDAIFSNFGGLNCIPDLPLVTQQIPALLRPGGLVTVVLMPPICLWELVYAFRGDFHYAFRRLARGGTHTHLEGIYFKTYYFSPPEVISSFDPDFSVLSIEGLSVFAPPANHINLPGRYPRLYRSLCKLDDLLAQRTPFYGWGDFFILTMRYRSPRH